MNLHTLKSRFHLLVGLLITLATISLAQTSDIVCPGSWKQVRNAGPPANYYFALTFEPRGPRGHVLLFGGSDQSSNRKGDTWTWDGTVWIHAADTGPSPRSAPAMAYDIGQNRLVLFGGTGTPGDRYKENQDTWEWDGTTWTQVATSGPQARSSHGMAYDGKRNKVVLFGGGITFVRPFLNDTWEWDGTAWSQRFPASPPGPNAGFGMVYDSAHARTVLFGGSDGVNPTPFHDTWTWDGTAWTKVADTGPSARATMGMAYDVARHRTVLFGGDDAPSQAFGDTWEWDGYAGRRWPARVRLHAA